jgi:hypothetical protein
MDKVVFSIWVFFVSFSFFVISRGLVFADNCASGLGGDNGTCCETDNPSGACDDYFSSEYCTCNSGYMIQDNTPNTPKCLCIVADCGAQGERCCQPGNGCNRADNVCVYEGGDYFCRPCGGEADPCCSGNNCDSGLECEGGYCEDPEDPPKLVEIKRVGHVVIMHILRCLVPLVIWTVIVIHL